MGIAIVFSVVLISAIGFATQLTQDDIYFWRSQLLLGMAGFGVWLLLSRVLLRLLIQRITQEPTWGVIGPKESGELVAEDFRAIYAEGQFRYFDNLDQVEGLALRGVIVLPGMVDDRVAHQLIGIRLSGVRVFNVAEFYERFLFKVPLKFLRKAWFATSAEFGLIHHDIVLRGKRLIDIVVAFGLVLVTTPIMLVAALLVFLYDRGPALYSQMRVGLDGQHFRLYKFRTMITDAEKDGHQ